MMKRPLRADSAFPNVRYKLPAYQARRVLTRHLLEDHAYGDAENDEGHPLKTELDGSLVSEQESDEQVRAERINEKPTLIDQRSSLAIKKSESNCFTQNTCNEGSINEIQPIRNQGLAGAGFAGNSSD